MNGGVLSKLSDNNLGEEDEIDCLVDDRNLEGDEEEWENDATLLRDICQNNGNNRLYEYRYQNGSNTSHKTTRAKTVNSRNPNHDLTKEATLVPNSKPAMQIKETELQNNSNSRKREINQPKHVEPSQVPRVQRILEKGKANLSRSKSELGEQHRKVLSQINKGKSGISEQNKRFLANITSGMDRSKRFVLPGFHFSSSSNSKYKESQNESIVDSSLEAGHEDMLRTEQCLVNKELTENCKKVEKLKDRKSNSQESQEGNKQPFNHIGENVNHDLDQMLTNLGIQISAAEAATSESICYTSSSKMVPSSLMTQSVFVTSNHKNPSVDNITGYDSSSNMVNPQTICDHRTRRRSELPSSYSSDRSLFSQTKKEEEPNKQLTPGHFGNSNNNHKILNTKAETRRILDESNSTCGIDSKDHQNAYGKIRKEEKILVNTDIDDYLRLERSLENDYGEFDFIDGDSTLSRGALPSYNSNHNYIDQKSENGHDTIKKTGRDNKPQVSLLDEVVEEMSKEKSDFLTAKENQASQANVFIREKTLTKAKQCLPGSSGKKSRRLSSTSLSSGSSISEPTNSYLTLNSEHVDNVGINKSTKNTSKLIPSAATNTPNISVYADHTLMLRSHQKRRRWLLIKSQNCTSTSDEYNNRGIKTDQTYLPKDSSINIPNLRRCSSLAQNFYAESSTENSPYLTSNGFENRNKIVNGLSQFNNTDHESQKLFLLNDISARHTVFNTDNIDNDNNNSAKNEVNKVSWLSTSLSAYAKNVNNSSKTLLEHDSPCNIHDQYDNAKGANTIHTKVNILNASNSSSDNKHFFRQRSRRSPWLLRSNLSNYARRRRGSSTSLHTIGLNEEETTNQNDKSSWNSPTFILQNGATNSNLTHDQNVQINEHSAVSSDSEKRNSAVLKGSISSHTNSDASAVAENNAMSLNRR